MKKQSSDKWFSSDYKWFWIPLIVLLAIPLLIVAYYKHLMEIYICKKKGHKFKHGTYSIWCTRCDAYGGAVYRTSEEKFQLERELKLKRILK
jgi:hypothetical protein